MMKGEGEKAVSDLPEKSPNKPPSTFEAGAPADFDGPGLDEKTNLMKEVLNLKKRLKREEESRKNSQEVMKKKDEDVKRMKAEI